MSWPSYEIEFDWGSDTLTAPQIGERALQMFRELRTVSDVMNNWQLIDDVDYKYISLAEAELRITEVVENSVNWKYDNGPDDAVHGFEVFAVGMRTPADVMKPDSVALSVTAGAVYRNRIWLQIGSNNKPTDLSAVTYETYLGTLEKLASLWPCPWALAKVYGPAAAETLIDVPGFKGYFTGPFGAPWIAYLSAPLAAGLTLPAEIGVAPTPGGGVMLSAVEGMMNLENAQHLRRAGMLYGILLNQVGIQTDFPFPVQHAARIGPY